MPTLVLHITNMQCGSCVSRVTQALNRVPGVRVEQVRIGAARLTAPTDDQTAIIAALKQAGYHAHPESDNHRDPA